MKKAFKHFKEKFKRKGDLPPPYRENDPEVRHEVQEESDTEDAPAYDVVDLLANCNIEPITNDSDVEYAEIQDMGIWHSTPLTKRHKSKISLTWVLKENLENTKTSIAEIEKNNPYQRQFKKEISRQISYAANNCAAKERVVGRNEHYHNMKFRSVSDLVRDSCSEDSSVTEEMRRRHRHRHRKKKRRPSGRFGYDIRDLDTFLTESSIEHPGNIPVVIAFPTTLYETRGGEQRELALPLGTVVNAVFKNRQWVYVQTPHGREGYVGYNTCLPLGILPSRSTSQKKTPCWESSTDIYPRPCGNLTDTEKGQLRTRTRSECRYKTRERNTAEHNIDTLYMRARSVCSNIDKLHTTRTTSVTKRNVKRQTLLVVNSDYKGSVMNSTLTVQQGDVVVLVQGRKDDVDSDWFYVQKRDGTAGFIPAMIAGHGYI